jgi:hypothetical protein
MAVGDAVGSLERHRPRRERRALALRERHELRKRTRSVARGLASGALTAGAVLADADDIATRPSSRHPTSISAGPGSRA